VQNPWSAAQKRLRQPDGSVQLDGELLKKLWTAFRTAFPSLCSKPTLVRRTVGVYLQAGVLH
jgi:hypothetical protein